MTKEVATGKLETCTKFLAYEVDCSIALIDV